MKHFTADMPALALYESTGLQPSYNTGLEVKGDRKTQDRGSALTGQYYNNRDLLFLFADLKFRGLS